jgi:hypothetical protein
MTLKKSIPLLTAISACTLISACGGGSPKKVIWDLHKGSKSADIGWYPKRPNEIGYDLKGDLDFTLIQHSADETVVRVFHQRCEQVSASRNLIPPNQDGIDSVYAYFARGVTIEEGLDIAQKVLTEWSGGVREEMPRGELNIHQIKDQLAKDLFRDSQFSIQGSHGGVVIITIPTGLPASGELKQKCTLTFRP